MRVINLTWPAEIRDWDQFHWMRVANLRTESGQRDFLQGRAHVYLINYESLHQLVDLVERRDGKLPYDVVVWDELTRAKNPSSKRINLYRRKVPRPQRNIGLTGTPMPNSHLDLFAQVRLVDDGKRLGQNFVKFKQEFFMQPAYAVAREILEEYVRATATVVTIGALQHLFGDRERQTLDPRSPNFARTITDKGTSLDFTMGRGAYVTLAAQLLTDEKIGRKGRVEKQDPMGALLTFFKGRLSREIVTALTTAKGRDFRRNQLDAAGIAKELVAPLSWQDVDKVLKREGLTRGSFIQMLNMLGVTHRLAE